MAYFIGSNHYYSQVCKLDLSKSKRWSFKRCKRNYLKLLWITKTKIPSQFEKKHLVPILKPYKNNNFQYWIGTLRQYSNVIWYISNVIKKLLYVVYFSSLWNLKNAKLQIILFLNFKFQNFWWEKYYLPLIDIGTLLAHALQMYLSCSWDNVLFSCRPFSHRKFTCQMFITWALANYLTWRHAFNLKLDAYIKAEPTLFQQWSKKFQFLITLLYQHLE